jgi:hypothetical protein
MSWLWCLAIGAIAFDPTPPEPRAAAIEVFFNERPSGGTTPPTTPTVAATGYYSTTGGTADVAGLAPALRFMIRRAMFCQHRTPSIT